MTDVAKARLALLVSALCFVLAACGGDGEGGNEDTLLTGFSGFVILCVVAYFGYRAWKKRNAGGA